MTVVYEAVIICDASNLTSTLTNVENNTVSDIIFSFFFRMNCLLTLITYDHVNIFMTNNYGIGGLTDSILREQGQKNDVLGNFYSRLSFFLEHSRLYKLEECAD